MLSCLREQWSRAKLTLHFLARCITLHSERVFVTVRQIYYERFTRHLHLCLAWQLAASWYNRGPWYWATADLWSGQAVKVAVPVNRNRSLEYQAWYMWDTEVWHPCCSPLSHTLFWPRCSPCLRLQEGWSRREAASQRCYTAHVHSEAVTLRRLVQWAETFLTEICKMATAEPVSTFSWIHIKTFWGSLD